MTPSGELGPMPCMSAVTVGIASFSTEVFHKRVDGEALRDLIEVKSAMTLLSGSGVGSNRRNRSDVTCILASHHVVQRNVYAGDVDQPVDALSVRRARRRRCPEKTVPLDSKALPPKPDRSMAVGRS